MLIGFAAFQSGQNFEDLLALFGFGVLGLFLRRFDWSPRFLIGFVLSNPIETFTNQSFQVASFRFRKSFEDGMDYVFSPIVIVLIVITIVSVVLGAAPIQEDHGGRAVEAGGSGLRWSF